MNDQTRKTDLWRFECPDCHFRFLSQDGLDVHECTIRAQRRRVRELAAAHRARKAQGKAQAEPQPKPTESEPMSAVIIKNLHVHSYAAGHSHWHYTAPHSRRELEGTSYWRGVNTKGGKGCIQPGDFIFVTHTDPSDEREVIGGSIYLMKEGGRASRLVSSFGGLS